MGIPEKSQGPMEFLRKYNEIYNPALSFIAATRIGTGIIFWELEGMEMLLSRNFLPSSTSAIFFAIFWLISPVCTDGSFL